MKLTLVNQESREETVYDSKGIPMAASLRAFELQEEIEKLGVEDPAALYEAEHREKLLDFVVLLFRYQFTAAQMLEECEDSFYALIPRLLSSVVQGVNAKIKEFPAEESAPNPVAPTARKKG